MSVSYMTKNGPVLVPMSVGGVNPEVLSRLSGLEAETEKIISSRATETSYGMAKLSNAEDVTGAAAGLALSAEQNNASISGTLANRISEIRESKWMNTECGAPVKNDAIVSEIYSQWQRAGSICFVQILAKILYIESEKRYTVCYGLPLPLFGFLPVGFLHCWESGLVYTTKVNENGELLFETHARPQAGWYEGSIAYPCIA